MAAFPLQWQASRERFRHNRGRSRPFKADNRAPADFIYMTIGFLQIKRIQQNRERPGLCDWKFSCHPIATLDHPIKCQHEKHQRGFFPMTIYIPTPLRVYTGGLDAVEVNAASVAEALGMLTSEHPELQKHLFTAEGKLRAFVNLYLNDEDVRYLPDKESTAVTAADTLSIVPSIAGGD